MAVILLLVPLFFLNIRDSHDWGDDFAQYILQAKNLAEGKLQTEGAYIFNPDYPFYAPPIYPVGYPLLLAPVYALFGNDLIAFNYFQTFLLFLFGVAMFFFLRKFMEQLPALLLTLIAVYNPWMLEFKANVLSDLAFGLFILLSSMAYLSFKEKMSWRIALITGFLTCFTILIKPAGIMLLAGSIADALKLHVRKTGLQKEVVAKQMVLLLTAVIVYLFITRLVIPSSIETTGHFQNLYQLEKLNRRFNINASFYLWQFQGWFEYTNPGWNFSISILRSFALTFFLLGFFGKIFNRLGFIEFFTLTFLLVILFFPDNTQGFRYLLPVFPFMMLYVYHGFESVKLGKLNRNAVFIVACLFCLFQYKTTIEKRRKQEHLTVSGPQEIVAQQAFDYISNNTERDAVVAFIKPRALSLYAHRKTLTNHPQQERQSMNHFFEKHKVAYYLLSRDLPNPALEKLIKEETPALVWSNEKFALYKGKN